MNGMRELVRKAAATAKDFDEFLSTPVLPGKLQRLETLVFGDRESRAEDRLFAGLTIGDLVYDVLRVDPTVIEAVDFAHREELADVFSFAFFAKRRVLEGTADEVAGRLARIRGYVAERVVAQELQSQGYEVDFPDDPTEEAVDIYVDGQPFQVKCTLNPELVEKHLEENPDIPVFVNRELAQHFEDNEMVIPMSALSFKDVDEVTSESIEAGGEVLDFEIPSIALAIAIGKNALALFRKQTDVLHAVQNILFDTALRSAGGYALSKAFALMGVVLGPAGSVVGGLLGSIIGAAKGKQISSWVKDTVLCAHERNQVVRATQDLLLSAIQPAEVSRGLLESKADKLETLLKGKNKGTTALWEKFRWRLEQELAYKSKKIKELKDGIKDPLSYDGQKRNFLEAVSNSVTLISQAGVYPSLLREELNRLKHALKELENAKARFLLTRRREGT